MSFEIYGMRISAIGSGEKEKKRVGKQIKVVMIRGC